MVHRLPRALLRTKLGEKYRWLAVGQRVRYVGKDGRPELRDRTGTVVAVPEYKPRDAPKNVVVRLDYAGAVVAPSGCFRPIA